MDIKDNNIKEVSEYYTRKIEQFGPTPQGVDWNSGESQILRFKQLVKLVDIGEEHFSLLDYGCGYGAMYDYLNTTFSGFNYTGYDVSKSMIDKAKEYIHNKKAVWVNELNRIEIYDYLIASGIFNVKLDNSDDDWNDYILKTLRQFNQLTSKGFSFNVLTKYSDKEFMKDNLYYADPSLLFDYCKLHFSKHVSLLDDYPLYEFTIIVRK